LKGASYENLKLHSKKADGKSFWYTYNYDGRATLFPFIAAQCLPFPGGKFLDFALLFMSRYINFTSGVCHANELLMMWNIPVFGATLNDEEQALSIQITKMWYNFAKYG
jgi:hypothetical protein